MPFNPMGVPAAMGNVAQVGRNAMGLGAVQRPMLSGSRVKTGMNQARMDPLAGQVQAAQMARNMGPVGAPPPPSPGLGPSAPPVNTALSSFGQQLGGMQPYGPPDTQAPNQQIPQLPSMADQGDPQANQDRMNFLNQLRAQYGMSQNPLMGQLGQQAGQFGNQMMKPPSMDGGIPMQGMQPNPRMGGRMGGMMGRGGIGPSFMGQSQQPQPMKQWNVG